MFGFTVKHYPYINNIYNRSAKIYLLIVNIIIISHLKLIVILFKNNFEFQIYEELIDPKCKCL